MRAIIDVIGKTMFNVRYRLGIAEEGKDFFTCKQYEFCDKCEKSNKPCHNLMKGLTQGEA